MFQKKMADSPHQASTNPMTRPLLMVLSFMFVTGCAGFLADMSSDGELNAEYKLKHDYAECLKQSAKKGVDCSQIKQRLLTEQEWNAMDGGV